MKQKRPTFGDLVKYDAYIVKRHKKSRMPSGHINQIETAWEKMPFRNEYGIYIGYRTLKEGVSDYEIAEWGSGVNHIGFSPTRNFEAWLIVPSERENPVYVLPEDVIK